MFMPESVAITKFCPMMRVTMKMGEQKFAGGNNRDANGAPVTCMGGRCSLWQQVGIQKVETKEKCSYCKAKEPEIATCEKCEHTGYVIKSEGVGACGLNQLATALHMERTVVTLDAMMRMLAADRGLKLGEDGMPIIEGFMPGDGEKP